MPKVREADINRFTNGDCHIFARAMNKLTGWPIHAFEYGAGVPDCHAFVVRPDGKPVDIQGAHFPSEFRHIWGAGDPYREFQWSAFLKNWGGPDFGHYSYERARVLAPVVLASL